MNNDEETVASVKIIDLTTDLWEVYKEIRLRGLQEEPQAFGRSYQEELAFPKEKWIERTANPYNTIAIENGRPIGTMGAFVVQTDGEQIATIVGVFVAPEARGKHIGSMLMERVLEKIKESGAISKVTLTVNKDQLAAVSLYQKFGFVITGEEEQLMGDGKQHIELLMELVL